MKKNKVIITGGCGFVGEFFCKTLLQKNFKLFIIDINNERLKKFENKFKKYNKNFKLFEVDITNENNVKLFYQSILKKNIQISGLINNASANLHSSSLFHNFKESDWDLEINISLKGSFLMTKHLVKHLIKNKYGRIINISSDLGLIGPNQNIYNRNSHKPASYSVSKHGIIGFTKYLASTYGKYGITSNCLSPGGIQKDQKKTFIEKNQLLNPIGRMAKLSDLEEALIFLTSPKNDYLNGANIVLDGGRTIW